MGVKATVTLRCWRCGRRMLDVRGDVHIVTVCQRCNARNEVTVADGKVIEPLAVDTTPRGVT